MVAWMFPVSQYYYWSSELPKWHTCTYVLRQNYCDSSLKLTLQCMHFSVSSKGTRKTKLISQLICSYLQLFSEVPTVSVLSNRLFILCLVIEGALWYGEYPQMVTVCHSTWSNTWIALNCSDVHYFLVCVMVWLFCCEPHHRAGILLTPMQKRGSYRLLIFYPLQQKHPKTAIWKDLVVIR